MSFENYVIAALWTSSNETDNSAEFLDANYSIADLADETRAYLQKIYDQFYRENAKMIDLALTHIDDDTEKLAIDLWLTQNRHGAGFWDGDYPDEIGKKLTEAAHKLDEICLYVGDDDKIYHI